MANTLIGLLGLGLLAVAPTISAADNYSITFLPPSPIAGQSTVAHVASNVGGICSTDPGTVAHTGVAITLSINVDDFCLPERQSYRDFSLGPLVAGAYTVTFQLCGTNPSPFPSGCHTETQAQLVVARAPIDPAPALSLWGLLGMTLGLGAVAGAAVRTFIPLATKDRDGAGLDPQRNA